jgi:dCMP deaminase
MESPNANSIVKRTPREWDEFFFRMAQDVSQLSKDPDRKVGAVLVVPSRRQVSFGFNGFPPEIPDAPALLADRGFKLTNMVHAEDNCLRQAPFEVRGCCLYVTRFPCLDCACKLRDAGITRLIAPKPDFRHNRWGKSWSAATAVFHLSNIALHLRDQAP